MKSNPELITFVNSYVRNYKSQCQKAADKILYNLSSKLEKRKIKFLGSARAKKKKSLLKKLRNRFKVKAGKIDRGKIFDEIVDLAGARIALYFPRDRMQVESLIFKHFENVEYISHPKEDKPRKSPKRFEGYCADHYRVDSGIKLKLSNNIRQKLRVEIQVVSMLMHSLMEIEHDLVYKPGSPILEYDELAFLDIVNGSVIAGEVALEAMEQKLMSRGILQCPPKFDWIGPLSKAKKKVLIVGQNLYSFLHSKSLEKTLFNAFKISRNLEIEIILADPQKPLLHDPLNYQDPKFPKHLKASIKKLREWVSTANKKNMKLKAYLSNQVERETVFFLEPQANNGLLILKRVPPGSHPDVRASVIITKRKHPKTFSRLLNKYSNICRKAL